VVGVAGSAASPVCWDDDVDAAVVAAASSVALSAMGAFSAYPAMEALAGMLQ
jgi:hypothetical protein